MMSELSVEQADAVLQSHVAQLIAAMGDDPTRHGLEQTPKRFLSALRYLTQGYRSQEEDWVNGALFESDMDEMIIVRDIELYSLCQHHLLPFIGKCHVAYLPMGKVLGLSKVARITDMFARRFQVQENLTKQIAECVMRITGAAGVGVIIEAKHLCMMMRGVEKQNSLMTTSMMLGQFRQDPRTRAEFLSLIRRDAE